MADGLIQTLAQLLEEGSVPWSSVSAKQRDQLRSLRETGVLTVERAGAGRRLTVQDEEVVRRFADAEYPAGLDAARTAAETKTDDHLAASEAVAHFRDAKQGTAGDEVLLFRGLPGTTITYEGAPLRIGRLTKVAGVAAVLLGPETEIAVEAPLAIVENREAFLRFDELGTAARLACFGRGRLSNQALEWLGSLDVGRNAICHCPDYDPVGLSEFQRLHDACGERVCLFWPDGLEALLQQYGKADLYERNASLLNGMDDSPHPTIEKLMVLLQKHGRGLEQEILLSKNAREKGGSSL